MTQWHSKDIGDGIEACPSTQAIQSAFSPVFVAAGQPIEMAVFSRYDLEKSIQTIYFSPACTALAQVFDATACEKPKREDGLGLLVGDARCWPLFYPTAEAGS